MGSGSHRVVVALVVALRNMPHVTDMLDDLPVKSRDHERMNQCVLRAQDLLECRSSFQHASSGCNP